LVGNQYDIVAKFYDNVIGRSDESVSYIINKILKYNKSAKSVLELGCGTGNNLDELSKDFIVSGIDLSHKMLKIAKKKIPGGKFYNNDIRNFSLNSKFDVIICMYDTINHLTLFNDWKRIFLNVYTHLNQNGLFIFDINTIYRLETISRVSPLLHKFDTNYLIIDVKKITKNIFNWNLKVFENKTGNNFSLYETNIRESGFEIDKIREELTKQYQIKCVEDESSKKLSVKSERVYFVCKKSKKF